MYYKTIPLNRYYYFGLGHGNDFNITLLMFLPDSYSNTQFNIISIMDKNNNMFGIKFAPEHGIRMIINNTDILPKLNNIPYCGWGTIRLVVSPEEQAVVYEVVNTFKTAHTFKQGTLPNTYFVSLFGDTDASDVYVYFDWIKIYNATLDEKTGKYIPTKLVYYNDFNNESDLNRLIIDPSVKNQITLTKIGNRTVLKAWGDWGGWDIGKQAKYLGVQMNGTKIILVRFYIPQKCNGHDSDAGVLILNKDDKTEIIEAIADTSDSSITLQTPLNNGWRSQKPLLTGWVTGYLIYDPFNRYIELSIPKAEYHEKVNIPYSASKYTYPNYNILFSTDTDSQNRTLYLDYIKIYRGKQIGSEYDREYVPTTLIKNIDMIEGNYGHLIIEHGTVPHKFTTLNNNSVLELWGNTFMWSIGSPYESQNFFQIPINLTGVTVTEFKIHINTIGDNDFIIGIGSTKPTMMKGLIFDIDNSKCDNSSTPSGWCVGYAGTNIGENWNSILFSLNPPINSGWVKIQMWYDKNDSRIILYSPSTGLKMSYYIGRPITPYKTFIGFNTANIYIYSLSIQQNPITILYKLMGIEQHK